jgi:hypothetical protein
MSFGCVVPLHEPSHSNDSSCPFMDLDAPKQALCAHQHRVSWTDMPHPWVHAPCLVCFLVSIDVTLMGVSMGSSNLSGVPMLPRADGSTPWACSQVAPVLAQMQPKSPSIFLRKVRCVPPWCRMSPSCTQGAPAHTHMSSFSNRSHAPCVLFPDSSPSLPKECTHGDLTGEFLEPLSEDIQLFYPREKFSCIKIIFNFLRS